MQSAYDRLVQLMQDVMSEQFYRGVKGQPPPTGEQVKQAAWKVVALASQEVGARG